MFRNSGGGDIEQYVRLLNHENGHYDAFTQPDLGGFNGIWRVSLDRDRDVVADAWETEHGVPFNVGGDDRRNWYNWQHDILIPMYERRVRGSRDAILKMDWSDTGENY
jgi:hypothetical protein